MKRRSTQIWNDEIMWSCWCQSLSCVQLFATPWTAVCQASLFFTIYQNLLKLTSIELVMLSNHLIFCHSFLLLPVIILSIRIFPTELALWIRRPSIEASTLASVPQMIVQGWFLLWLTGLISLLSKRLSRIFSSTTVWKHQFFAA